MSHIKPTTSVWAGEVLLAGPLYCVSASLLRVDAPGLSLFGNPVILIGSLMLALALNASPVFSISVWKANPPEVNLLLALRFKNLAVIAVGGALFAALLSYAFVENFQARDGG
jgi:hypothetical protein